MMGGAKAHYDGIVAFSQTDFTEDLKKINVPVLVMRGDDDQIVRYADSGPLSAKLLKNGILKTYKGFPHGMPTTNADTINADLLAFIRDWSSWPSRSSNCSDVRRSRTASTKSAPASKIWTGQTGSRGTSSRQPAGDQLPSEAAAASPIRRANHGNQQDRYRGGLYRPAK